MLRFRYTVLMDPKEKGDDRLLQLDLINHEPDPPNRAWRYAYVKFRPDDHWIGALLRKQVTDGSAGTVRLLMQHFFRQGWDHGHQRRPGPGTPWKICRWLTNDVNEVGLKLIPGDRSPSRHTPRGFDADMPGSWLRVAHIVFREDLEGDWFLRHLQHLWEEDGPKSWQFTAYLSAFDAGMLAMA